MKRIAIISIVLLFTTLSGYAQGYNTGIGFRGGLSAGITGKHFISDQNAVEGILSTRWEGFYLTGLYEIHANAFEVPGLYWFYGFGGHIGFWDGYKGHPWFDEGTGTHTILGIDGIIGMEYVIDAIPFTVGLDWKPGFNIFGYTGFWGDELALSVRYIF